MEEDRTRWSIPEGIFHPDNCGMAECDPLHSYGPAVRPNYLIHVVLRGRGVFAADGREYQLKEGDGFLIEPDVPVWYQADGEQPWKYLWVAFSGRGSREYLDLLGLDRSRPVFSTQDPGALEKTVEEMLLHHRSGGAHHLFLSGLLYRFLGQLATQLPTAQGGRRSRYVREAMEYIRSHYSNGISVNEIAAWSGINRSYLFTLFQNELGMSPQEYLAGFRLRRGRELLETTDLGVESVAISSGYRDPLVFSKAFKQMTGKTPRQYRQEHREAEQCDERGNE